MEYEEHDPDKKGWTKWIYPNRKKYLLMCCDCGLIHDFQFKLHKNKRGSVILFRAKRNESETKKQRKK